MMSSSSKLNSSSSPPKGDEAEAATKTTTSITGEGIESNNGKNSTSRTTSSGRKERHTQFIECLERHGSDLTGNNDWLVLADDLGWDVEEVQLHAYQYMKALMMVDDNNNNETNNETRTNISSATIMENNSISTTNTNNNNTTEWSLEETILFDTLVATYLPHTKNGFLDISSSSGGIIGGSGSNGITSDEYSWEELVAARLPGRTPAEVEQRFYQLYDNDTNSS